MAMRRPRCTRLIKIFMFIFSVIVLIYSTLGLYFIAVNSPLQFFRSEKNYDTVGIPVNDTKEQLSILGNLKETEKGGLQVPGNDDDDREYYRNDAHFIQSEKSILKGHRQQVKDEKTDNGKRIKEGKADPHNSVESDVIGRNNITKDNQNNDDIAENNQNSVNEVEIHKNDVGLVEHKSNYKNEAEGNQLRHMIVREYVNKDDRRDVKGDKDIMQDATVASEEHDEAVEGRSKLNDSFRDKSDNTDGNERKATEWKYKDVTFPRFVDSHDPNLLGEWGAPVKIESNKLQGNSSSEYLKEWQLHQFNVYVSKMISIHRNLPDCRNEECKKLVSDFNSTLSVFDVVIIYNNEAWTTLLRSVHSILSRTPEHLLKEIVLVDDCSDQKHLKAPLDKYFRDYPKVKIIRSPERIGLTRARLLGFEASQAPVVVFLDSHIECFQGWVESLLVRIAHNPQAVIFPYIEPISDQTLETTCSGYSINHYGSFSLDTLIFEWIEIPEREHKRRKSVADTFRSPTMPGGLFAIGREFFNKVGKYDPRLDFWGGENMELSFKTWMCGGSLELDPCSRIGHIFRNKVSSNGSYDTVVKNSIRVAEVWMDDYKNYYYEALNYSTEGFGDVSGRKRLRENLKCHSFDWYVKNVFPEMRFPSNKRYVGEIKNEGNQKCLASTGVAMSSPGFFECHGAGANQMFYMDDKGQITHRFMYICKGSRKRPVVLTSDPCSKSEQKQWEYRKDKTLLHVPSGQCLGILMEREITSLMFSRCSDSINQKWSMTERRKDLIFPS